MAAGGHADGAVVLASIERRPLQHRIAAAVVRRWLSGWRVGSLTIELPDGATWSFGATALDRRVSVTVRDWRFFSRILARSDVGLGESYMAGEWECDDLVGFIELVLTHAAISGRTGLVSWLERLARLPWRHRTADQVVRDVRAHYDLGNTFFASFLDETMTYSAGIFTTPATTLAEAQREKLDGICRDLALAPGMDVLDLGAGWGSFAIHAASHYGCRVRAVTLSAAQHELAIERVRAAGLGALVDVELRDYRMVEGRFDRLVSIEMFEAIGFEQYGTFFRTCERLLAPNGCMFLQTSAYPDRDFDSYRQSVDWIRTHVFPGGLLASLRGMQETLARETRLRIERLEDIGPHYARTLHHWRERYHQSTPEIRRLGFDAPFRRKWNLYLAMCEAAFAVGRLATLQLLLRPADAVSAHPS